MEFQQIDVFIDKDGKVRVEVRGAKGQSCLELTRDLEAALGGQIEAREMTAESYEAQPEQLPNQQKIEGKD
jgi:hypothetical protein